jgi:3D (Asp-Asp-Asp) domain-containing protein
MTKRRDHEASSIVGFATTIAKDSLSYLADLFSRIVNSLRNIAPLVVSVGCQSKMSDPPAIPEPMPHEVVSVPAEVAPAPKEEAPKPIGDFSITFYYVVTEEEVVSKPAKKPPVTVAANDNASIGGVASNSPGAASDPSDPELASIAPPDQVTLYEGTCEPIADVSREFASALALQGTGKLKDGRVVNIWGHCKCGHSPCFKVTAAQWGTGGTGRQLQPFRTVAVDPKMVKLGSLLYVPLLEGRQMPGRAPWGGFVHDGCVVADDVGGGIKGTQLDLFVGRRGWFLGMSGKEGSHAWARAVPVYDGTKLCERNGRHVARKAGSI